MNHGSDNVSVFGHSDTWFGVGLIAVGGCAAWMATGFDALSRSYPMTLSLLLLAFGALLIAKVFAKRATHVSFAIPSYAAAVAAVIIVLWIGAITIGLGYVLPTFAMQFAFLFSCGVRGPSKAAVIAAVISCVSYLAFIVGLGVRMPTSFAPWLL